MALNPTPTGKAIADLFFGAGTPGTPITKADLEALWEQAITVIYNDLKANMGVQPGSFEVVVPPGGSGGTFPVLGSGGPAT